MFTLHDRAEWSHWSPTHVEITDNLADTVRSVMQRECPGAGKVLLVAGTGSARRHGYFNCVATAIGDCAAVTPFDGVVPDPSPEAAFGCARLIREQEIDAVVALGGGSVIDFCKVAASFRDFSGNVENVLADRNDLIPKRKIPLIAIPTTAGTGSEVTPYAVLTGRERRKLFSISDNYYPTVGIIAPELYLSVPKHVIREVGMDAFTHALESLWSKRATPMTDALAMQALLLFHDNLVPYYHNPADRVLARQVAIGAMLAGQAFAGAYTSICHALSFPLATKLGLSHGKCCSLTAVECAKFNAEISRPEIDRLAKQIGLASSEQLAGYIATLRHNLDDSDTLTCLGIDANAFRVILAAANSSMIANNIRPLDSSIFADFFAADSSAR